MMRLNVILTLGIMLSCFYAEACLQEKLCCRKLMGKVECVKRCSNQFCPMGYDIEIKL